VKNRFSIPAALAVASAFSLALVFGGSGAAVAGHHGPGFWGEQVDDQSRFKRTVVVEPDTKWIHVTGGETIRFVLRQQDQEQSFVWRFTTYGGSPTIDLGAMAPLEGIATEQTYVIVKTDPKYRRGGQ